MDLGIEEQSLIVYKALASDVRLAIIRLLSKDKMTVTEIANNLKLSNTIVLMHLDKLYKANLISF